MKKLLQNLLNGNVDAIKPRNRLEALLAAICLSGSNSGGNAGGAAPVFIVDTTPDGAEALTFELHGDYASMKNTLDSGGVPSVYYKGSNGTIWYPELMKQRVDAIQVQFPDVTCIIHSDNSVTEHIVV